MAENKLQQKVAQLVREAWEMEEQSLEGLDGAVKAMNQGARVPYTESLGIWDVVGDLDRHKDETREQIKRLHDHLIALGHEPEREGGLLDRLSNKMGSVFAELRGERPADDSTARFAMENLEIAAYEILIRAAQRAGDEETEAIAREHLEQERQMAQHIADDWDRLYNLTLATEGIDWEREVDAGKVGGTK